MHLKGHLYIGGKTYKEVEGSVKGVVNDSILDIPLDEIDEISIEIGYWRKANSVHGWFVRNLAEGVDDCSQIIVSEEDFKNLQSACKQALAEETLKDKPLSKKLLPVQEGFFFGSDRYDGYYYDDLRDTLLIIDEVFEFLTKYEDFYPTIIYQASW